MMSKIFKVVDKNGNPIPSATAFNEKTKTGYVADFDGVVKVYYKDVDPIKFESMGYKPKVVKAYTQQKNIVLEESNEALDPVVITAKKNNNFFWKIITGLVLGKAVYSYFNN